MRLLEGNYNHESNFSSTDTKELFNSNLKTQSTDWIWRNKTVHYSLNSQRYRCPEWTNCNWDNSILIFGCSIVYGVGIDDQDTLPEQLSKNLNIPVLNLGQSGIGIDFIWANSVILKTHKIKPRACVFVWPDWSRQTEFISEFDFESHGSWDIDRSKFSHLILNDTHNQHRYNYMIRNIKLLWDCPIIEATYYCNISQTFNCQMLDFLDRARDLQHPGPESTKEAAKIIAERLNNSR